MIVDANVSLSRWPTRRLPGDDAPALVARLKAHGVGQAWAGSFDGLLHRDLAAANRRLAAECRRHGSDLLVPFGTVNPTQPDWEEDLRRCHAEHHMPGVRLFPNYHGYRLDHPAFVALLRAAAERGLVVQVALKMEDERAAHPLLRVLPVDTVPLARVVAELPRLRLVLLNGPGLLGAESVRRLAGAGRVYFDIAMLEGVGGVGRLLQDVPADRVLFGSHFPFFYFESALLKLRESPLAEAQRRAIEAGNAGRLLKP